MELKKGPNPKIPGVSGVGCDTVPLTLYKDSDSCTIRFSLETKVRSLCELNPDEGSNFFLKREMALVLCATRWLRQNL
jgi:hypothetical protein